MIELHDGGGAKSGEVNSLCVDFDPETPALNLWSGH